MIRQGRDPCERNAYDGSDRRHDTCRSVTIGILVSFLQRRGNKYGRLSYVPGCKGRRIYQNRVRINPSGDICLLRGLFTSREGKGIQNCELRITANRCFQGSLCTKDRNQTGMVQGDTGSNRLEGTIKGLQKVFTSEEKRRIPIIESVRLEK